MGGPSYGTPIRGRVDLSTWHGVAMPIIHGGLDGPGGLKNGIVSETEHVYEQLEASWIRG